MPHGEVPYNAIQQIEAKLDEPHPDELSADEQERRRRRKIAEENRGATERLAGITQLDRTRR